MKISLITFHTPKNYGAVLQAYSLMQYLRTFSEDVRVIDFNTPHLRSLYPLRKKTTSLRMLRHNILVWPYLKHKKNKYEKFERFVSSKLRLTKRYESLEALEMEPPEADIYVTGSDQVFNPIRIQEERKAFYLGFGPRNIKRISYAASFGTSTIPQDKQAEIAEYLDCFDAISIREESGIEIVKQLSSQSAQEVLDPVFLNDVQFWRETAKPYSKPFAKYLFYYRLMGYPQADTAVRELAAKKGLQLVVMTDNRLRWKADVVLRDVGPEEFLSLMDGADYIATDSFHGVAFSLLFQKQFIFTDIDQKFCERSMNLLGKLDLQDSAYINGNRGAYKIDYCKVEQKLLALVEMSKKFLKNNIC